LYKNGYVKQSLSKEGEQINEFVINDFANLPLREVKRKNGQKLIISIELPGRTLYARVWKCDVGRTPVYFMDTDVSKNSETDREITAKLYTSDKKTRFEQEMLLGIGGFRLLEKELGITPCVYHMNEGHPAFLVIERLVDLIKTRENMDIDAAREVVKSSTIFTTHTPVPAGNESFDMTIFSKYFDVYLKDTGTVITLKELVEMGHVKFADMANPYEMTVLALRNSCKRNGVSKLHGLTSRKMWVELWNHYIEHEVPITHVTNGVHMSTWLAEPVKEIIHKYVAQDINRELLNSETWAKVNRIPSKILWKAHVEQKNKLFEMVKRNVTEAWEKQGESPHLLNSFLSRIDPNALTIGFARRFATYKRGTLILKNVDKLKKLLLSKERPVQLIFSGKAHPMDREAYGLIREVVKMSKQDEFLGKIIFLEDYDMRISKLLVAGVDVWLNNPRRPLEASGTSGQKAGANGVMNFSILDGWWEEGYNGLNGWAIGDIKEYKNPEMKDIIDNNSIYDILEGEIIPAYYARKNGDYSEKWVEIMKQSMSSVISGFNTNRMIRDYVEKMYVPAARRHAEMAGNGNKNAREIALWKKTAKANFQSVNIANITIEGIHSDNVNLNDEIIVYLELDRGKMAKEELRVEMLIMPDRKIENVSYDGKTINIDAGEITYNVMSPIEERDNRIKYKCKYKAETPGKFNYGVRVTPYRQGVEDIIDLNLVCWA